MSAYVDASVVAGAAVACTSLIALFSWVFRRGGSEREMAISLRDNTESNKELTGVVQGLQQSLTLGFREVHDRIDSHDVQIAVAKRDIEHLNERVVHAAGAALKETLRP